jgi:riboflavin biosynthesis pyrimidine reductase
MPTHPRAWISPLRWRCCERRGFRSLLVEGGAAVITSFLRQRLADRVVVGIAPTILGAGTEAVGDLSAAGVSEGLRLTGRSVRLLGDDVVLAGDVV